MRPTPAQLTWSLQVGRCWCGEPKRGDVDAAGEVPAHHCRQCAEHCLIAVHLGSFPESA